MEPQERVADAGETPGGEVLVEDFLAQMASQDQAPRRYADRADGQANIRHTLRMGYSHQAMADILLMRPEISGDELAAMFGRSRGWISTIKNSDAFQALVAARRAELIDPEITLSLRERATGVAAKSMQVIQDKLNAAVVSDNFALRAFELSQKALGMGGNAPPPAPPNPAEYLPALAERLERLQGRRPSIEDAVILPPEAAA